MKTNPNSFTTLKILHTALLAGVFFLSLASVFLVARGEVTMPADRSMDRTLQVVAVVLSGGALLIGFRLFKKKIMDIRNSTEAGSIKLIRYRTACVIWWAFIEAPALFSIVCFLLTGNYAFFALAFFHVIVLAVFMPRKDNIILLLNLRSDEFSKLEG
jgi:hypothetical protein